MRIVEDMKKLLWEMATSPCPPNRDQVIEKIEDWVQDLESMDPYSCESCGELQQEIDLLNMELSDAINDFEKIGPYEEKESSSE